MQMTHTVADDGGVPRTGSLRRLNAAHTIHAAAIGPVHGFHPTITPIAKLHAACRHTISPLW